MTCPEVVNGSATRHDAAEQVLLRAVELEPERAATLHALGRVRRAAGQAAGAAAALEQSFRINPFNPSTSELLQCRMMLQQFRRWYERRILGCTVARVLEIESGADLDRWLEESEAHRQSDLGAKDAPIALICKTGDRSTVGASVLEQHGFTNVYNISGGMLALEG